MDAFGWFTEDRYGYDRNYGIVDQNWHRFAAKYNIWQKSHVDGTQCAVDYWRDANGNVQNYQRRRRGRVLPRTRDTGLPIPDPERAAVHQERRRAGRAPRRDGDGTEDECEFKDVNGNVVNPGSRCDEFTNKCDIPLYDRTTKTTPLVLRPQLGAGPLRVDRPRRSTRGTSRSSAPCSSARRSRRPASIIDIGQTAPAVPDERGRPHRRPAERDDRP